MENNSSKTVLPHLYFHLSRATFALPSTKALSRSIFSYVVSRFPSANSLRELFEALGLPLLKLKSKSNLPVMTQRVANSVRKRPEHHAEWSGEDK